MRPSLSHSCDWQIASPLRTALEEEDTEETGLYRCFRGTESTCPSPLLYRGESSAMSSFRREEEGSTTHWPRTRFSTDLHGEEAIRKIQLESLETKGYMKELARQLSHRADLVKTSSKTSSKEVKLMKDYMASLNSRLDRLLKETESTQQALATVSSRASQSPPRTRGARRAKTSSVEGGVRPVPTERRSQPICHLESPQSPTWKCIFCHFFKC